MPLIRKAAYAILAAAVAVRFWLTKEQRGHYSLSSEPGVHLKEMPETIRQDSYYKLHNRHDHWEVVKINRGRDRVTLRSVLSLVEIHMTVEAFEELFTFHCNFTPATYEQIIDGSTKP